MTNLVYEASHTTHWKSLFPRKNLLLGSHNLNPGEELIATIKGVSTQSVKDNKGKEESLPVVEFENAAPMVLNITNARTIASLYGESWKNWIGMQVQIYATEVRVGRETVSALRIRPQVPSRDLDTSEYEAAIEAADNIEALKEAFLAMPKHVQAKLNELKNKKKAELDAGA